MVIVLPPNHQNLKIIHTHTHVFRVYTLVGHITAKSETDYKALLYILQVYERVKLLAKIFQNF